MKSLITLLICFIVVQSQLSSQVISQNNVSASELLGEWRGKMLLNGDHPHSVTLKIKCEKDGSVQGAWNHICPSYLPCDCDYRMDGIFISKSHGNILKLKLSEPLGGSMCGEFTVDLKLNSQGDLLLGRTSGNYTVQIQKRKKYTYSECEGDTKLDKSEPHENKKDVDIKYVTCRSCGGTGSTQACGGCNGTGTQKKYWTDEYGQTHEDIYPCSGGCNGTGKHPCSWCAGTGKERKN